MSSKMIYFARKLRFDILKMEVFLEHFERRQTAYTESCNCVFQVSFSSRIPVAFPSGDASSLSKNIMMYACINATKDSHHTLLHEDMMAECSPHGSQLHSGPHSTNMNILAPTVMMVSKHIDGSLNQWAVTFADKSALPLF